MRTVWHPNYFDALAAARGRLLGKVSMDKDEEASKDDTGVTEDTGALFATAAGEGTDDDAADNVESEYTRQVEQESPDDEEERKDYRKRLLQYKANITTRVLAKQIDEGGTGEQQTESKNTRQVEQESPDDEEERKDYRKRLLQYKTNITARVLAKQSVEGGTGEQQTESENTGQVEQESPNDEDERKEYRKRLLQIQARITARDLAEQHN